MPFARLGRFASLAVLLAGPPLGAAAAEDAVGLIAAASPAAGEKLFLRCKACHTAEKGGRHRLGPNLWDVVGRDKASAKAFRYSPALERLGGVWDYAALDGYLADPRGFAPGNRMAFPGLKDASRRAAVIAYLRRLSDSPGPLPKAATRTAGAPAATAAAEEDYGGLPPGPGREETYGLCAACHSLRLVTQQGLDAESWEALLDWMTVQQGMPELDEDERRLIVGYLARNFGPDREPAAGGMAPGMPMMAPPPMMPAMPPPPPE